MIRPFQRLAARLMIQQGLGGDLVYVVSKNAVFAGPDNLAYGAAKADQAHQVRLLAAELGQHGLRVNGVNPDAVVRGSGTFAGGWGGAARRRLRRARGRAGRLLRQAQPARARSAARARRGRGAGAGRRGPFPHDGLLIPVDAGVAAAFLR